VPLNIKSKKHDFWVRASYFRCAIGDEFVLNTDIDCTVFANKYNPKIEVCQNVFDSSQRLIAKNKTYYKLNKESPCIKDWVFAIEKPHGFFDDRSPKYVRFDLTFIGFPEKFIVRSVRVTKKTTHIRASVEFNSKIIAKQNDRVDETDIYRNGAGWVRHQGPAASVILEASNVYWQIRNAIGEGSESDISILNYSHNFQRDKEVIIAPTSKKDFFVNKVTNIMPIKIKYKTKGIEMMLGDFHKNSRIDIISAKSPAKLLGADLVTYSGSKIIIQPKAHAISIKF